MQWFTYKDTFPVEAGVDGAALLAYLAECLRESNAVAADVSANSVSFRAGFLGGSSETKALIAFARGEITLNESARAIDSTLRVRDLVYVISLAMGIGFVSVWFDTGRFGFALAAFSAAWLILLGANLAIGLPRFRRFMREAIARFPAGGQ